MRTWSLGALLILGATTALATADDASRDAARRVLTLLHGIAAEYAEAFDDKGALVRSLELEEARALAREAVARTDALGAPLSDTAHTALTGLLADLETDRFTATLVERTESLSRVVTSATGVQPELFPSHPPAAARGAALFAENCARCHGPGGAGDGADAAGLVRQPANFRDPAFMRGETPEDFFTVITLGRRQSGMPAWGDVFAVDERWDLVAHLQTLAREPGAVERGRRVFRAQCAPCHGLAGAGDGKEAASLPGLPPDFSRPGALAIRTDAELLALVEGNGGEFHDFSAVLDTSDQTAVIAYVRALVLDREATLGTTQIEGATALLERIRRALDRVAEAPGGNPAETLGLVTDAYLQFEPLEPAISARDPGAVPRVEQAFLQLREAVERPGAGPDLRLAIGQVQAALRQAADTFAATQGVPTGAATGAILIVVALALPTLARRHRR